MASDYQSQMPAALADVRDLCLDLVGHCAVLRLLWDGKCPEILEWDAEFFDNDGDYDPGDRDFMAAKFMAVARDLEVVLAEARECTADDGEPFDLIPFSEPVDACHAAAGANYPAGVMIGELRAITYHAIAVELAESIIGWLRDRNGAGGVWLRGGWWNGWNEKSIRDIFRGPHEYEELDRRVPNEDYYDLARRINAEAGRAWREWAVLFPPKILIEEGADIDEEMDDQSDPPVTTTTVRRARWAQAHALLDMEADWRTWGPEKKRSKAAEWNKRNEGVVGWRRLTADKLRELIKWRLKKEEKQRLERD